MRLQQHTTGTTGYCAILPDSKLVHAQCKSLFITPTKWPHHHVLAHHRPNRVLQFCLMPSWLMSNASPCSAMFNTPDRWPHHHVPAVICNSTPWVNACGCCNQAITRNLA
jgi:hypothetical protein